MARSMLSFGMFSARAAWMARRRRGFMSGSGLPILAATVISRPNLANALARAASARPFLCMMFLNAEWPAMAALLATVSFCRIYCASRPLQVKPAHTLGVILGLVPRTHLSARAVAGDWATA